MAERNPFERDLFGPETTARGPHERRGPNAAGSNTIGPRPGGAGTQNQRAPMPYADLERLRLMGLAAILVNLMSLFLMRTLDASLRALTDGTFRGEAFWLAIVLVLASVIATVSVSFVLASCFWTHFTGRDQNPFVGPDFLPAWADLAIIAALLITGGGVLWTGF